jgi:pilus assembly protein FimV
MKKRVLTSMVAAAAMGVLTPLTSHAFGLGKINVMSALNEPFKAEIDVTALRPEEKDNLQVKMASQSEFDKAGLSHSMLLNQMQFDIVQRGGQHKILITSKQAIKEPFLDFLVTATAGSGVMLREYTVLLDPPEYVLAETRPASSRPAPIQTAPVETRSPSTTRYQYSDSSSGFSGSSYKVKRSDTLWNVALATRPADDLTVHQMMMALQKRNPTAFTNDNVNGLKAGVTLQIPSRSEIEALSSSAARQAFAEQNEAWKNRSRPAATQVAQVASEPAAPETVAPAVESSESDEQDSSPVQTAETIAEAPEARLQLVAPEEEVSAQQDASPNLQGNNQLSKLTEQLTLAQETIEAQAQENIDLQARMALLEEQIETMRRMLSVEDTDLARMQAMLEEESATAPSNSLQQTDMPVEAEASSAESDSAQEETEVAAAVQTSDAEQAASAEEPTSASEEDASVVTKVAKALDLDEAQVQTTFDKVKQFIADNKMPTILGLLLVLLVLWLIARRSNREVTWDEAVKKLDKTDSAKATMAVVTPEIVDDLTDAPAADEQPTEEKTAAELVEQADMFVGYADYVQAKSSLEQAIALEPANTLVAYKTLFVLYKLNQADEFVELAEQTEFETDSFEWSEISQWGKQLAPGHSLFADNIGSSSFATEEADTTDLAFNDLESPTDAEIQSSSDDIDLDLDTDVTEAAEADSGHIEFNLDDFATSNATEADTADINEDVVESTATKQVEDDLLSFDTNFNHMDSDDDISLDMDTDGNEQDDNSLSFDADDETTLEADNFELDAEDLQADSDSPDLEFDIGDLDDIDEAETKLDLASAYIDMGDPDGARSILNEVLVEGSEEQKNRAHELLESLS